MTLDIGKAIQSIKFRGDGSTIAGIIERLRHNKLKIFYATNHINSAVENSVTTVGVIAFKRWRVVGIGVICLISSNDGDDPVIHFGNNSDSDRYSILTITAEAGHNFHAYDYTSRDLYGISPPDQLQTGISVAWTDPDPAFWNVWETKTFRLMATAKGAGHSGYWLPYFLVEIDTEGKF